MFGMNKYKTKLFGVGIGIALVTAVFFRFFHFPTNPPSLNWDEVAFGYNAYSILKTGRDEYGVRLPLYFRSLDDFKLPVYTYLTTVSIALFGYNDFSVRFPSACLGVLTVVLVGVLTWMLFKNRWIALSAAGTLAILPWNIQFSRMAAEANVGLFFLVLGATLFVYGIKKKNWLLLLSVISFGLSVYSYLAFRIVSPLIGLLLIFLYRKELLSLDNMYRVGLTVVALLIGTLLIRDTFSSSVHIRLKATSVFNTQEALDIFKHKQKEMFYDAKLKINLTRRIFHDNKIFTSADIIIRAYLMHFSPTFLFFDYDQKQHHTPFVGLCYIFMIPFILTGVYFLIRNYKKREVLLILGWLIIAPIPASVTWDIPHAIRVYAMVIPIVIITAIGIYNLYSLFKIQRKIAIIYLAGLGFFAVCSSYYYFHQYMIHLPVERSHEWVYGRKEMTDYLEANKKNYDRIILSTSLEWSYIFLLYYSKYDPAIYLTQGGTKSGSWEEEENKFDTYEFHKFRAEDLRTVRTLFVGTPDEFIKTVVPMHIIYYLDGKPAIYIAEGDGKL